MTMDEYQARAQRTSRTDLSPMDHVMNGLLGLAGESGECCDVVKKSLFQDNREIRDKLVDELGDVLWYVQETAHGLGVSLETVASYNIEKLRRRYPQGFDADRSLHREGESNG